MNEFTAPIRPSVRRAFRSVFESSDWVINVLWLTIAVLAQGIFIGQIALLGWGSDQLRLRAGRPEFHTPPIDSNRLGDYISAGVWPFVVFFLIQCLTTAIVAVPMVGLGIIGALGEALAEQSGAPGGGIAVIFVVPAVLLTILGTIFLSAMSVPFLIRAMITQDFRKAFELNWVFDFVRVMFFDIIWVGIKFGLMSMLVAVGGFLALCIGYLPALGIINGAGINLLAQLYECYLDRGGRPVEFPPEPPEPNFDYNVDPIIDAREIP